MHYLHEIQDSCNKIIQDLNRAFSLQISRCSTSAQLLHGRSAADASLCVLHRYPPSSGILIVLLDIKRGVLSVSQSIVTFCVAVLNQGPRLTPWPQSLAQNSVFCCSSRPTITIVVITSAAFIDRRMSLTHSITVYVPVLF